MMCAWLGHIVFINLLLSQTVDAKPPHILFIVADDYGWHDIGYHDSEIRTPNLDRLAKQGVKLENYYVQALCTPSRSQLMTGRYQIHTGLQNFVLVPTEIRGLPVKFPTLPEKLREAGYATHIVGKWHLGFSKKQFLPTHRGFDSFFGILNGRCDYYKKDACCMFTTPPRKQACGKVIYSGETPVANYTKVYNTHLFAQKSKEVVSRHAANCPNQPLFLYLPFTAVHTPLQVPAKYEQQYSFIKSRDRRKYAGMTTCMDEAVEAVVNSFKEHNLWNDTLLVFTTDNGGKSTGGANNWPLRGQKADYFEGGVRGVGFVHSPLLPNKGGINTELLHVSDWFPTLIHLAGGSTADLKIDGHQVWESISQSKPSPRKEILHFIDPQTAPIGQRLYMDTFDTRIAAAIRQGDWKLLTGNQGTTGWNKGPATAPARSTNPNDAFKGNVRLFNIASDPNEENNAAASHPDIVRSLLDRLAFYNSTQVPCLPRTEDHAGHPKHHGGFWGPWLSDDEPSEPEELVSTTPVFNCNATPGEVEVGALAKGRLDTPGEGDVGALAKGRLDIYKKITYDNIIYVLLLSIFAGLLIIWKVIKSKSK